MNRHVIKGRGEHRGQYLCYARQALQEPAGDGYVWSRRQRDAARWHNRETWAKGRARLHDGYFVKLVAPAAITPEVVSDLRSFIAERAGGAQEALPCYWFSSDFHDAGDDFCRDCAEEIVAEKYAADPKRFEELFGECGDDEERFSTAIDGGFDIESDGLPFCERCGAKLSGYLTEYGADEEIAALTGDCKPTIADVEGWDALDRAIANLEDDDPRWRTIDKLVRAARREQERAQAMQGALASSPGMSEVRSRLLELLRGRAEQKAPEPSYPLWRELLAYVALPFDERHRPTKDISTLKRRLWREAKRMLACLGYEPRGDCFETPYGCYHWAFVVQIEQHKLWQTPAFLEARAYLAHPCPSGDPEWPHCRDANPHPEGTEAHVAWDCGFVSADRFGVSP